MKDKLYDFIDKRHTLLSVCAFAGLFGMIFAGNNKQLVAVILFLLYSPVLCALMFHMAEGEARSYEKARQRLQDQHNNASPRWDGLVRYAKDIEPRLKLLRDRMAQGQEEFSRLSAELDRMISTPDTLTP
jgi:hypothetical protein